MILRNDWGRFGSIKPHSAIAARAAARWLLVSLFAVVVMVPVAGAQSFQLLDRPAGMARAQAWGISADGRVVSGHSLQASGHYGPGWVWTAETGVQALAGGGLSANSRSFGLSGDGNVAVGETGPATYDSPAQAYRYDRTTGQVQLLGYNAGYGRSRAVAASADGRVAAGFSFENEGMTFTQAFRWTEAGGFQNLGFTRPNHGNSEAAAVSADGQSVVGFSQGLTTQDAFLWTPTTGMTIMPALPNSIYGHAYGLNSDASIIVGVSGAQRRAVMWEDGAIIDLGLAMGFPRSLARGVSEDGSVVVGMVDGGLTNPTAAIWVAGSGWRPLREYLSSIGVSVPDSVSLLEATGISRDGRTIIGYTSVSGNTQQGFIATIPAPAGLAVLLCPLTASLRRPRRGGVFTLT